MSYPLHTEGSPSGMPDQVRIHTWVEWGTRVLSIFSKSAKSNLLPLDNRSDINH